MPRHARRAHELARRLARLAPAQAGGSCGKPAPIRLPAPGRRSPDQSSVLWLSRWGPYLAPSGRDTWPRRSKRGAPRLTSNYCLRDVPKIRALTLKSRQRLAGIAQLSSERPDTLTYGIAWESGGHA